MTQQFSLFLFVVSCERKNSENLCSEFSRKNVLLNALCLLTSLSCQFFCSAFVVAKDLCASSFVSDLRCQRCPFDVECRPHTRHHLCSSRKRARECFSVLAYVWIDACGCRSLWVFAWENVCTCNYQRVCDHKSTSSGSRGSRMGVKHHRTSSLTVPNDYGNHDSLMLSGGVCHRLWSQ